MHAVWFDHPNSPRLVETSLPAVERECRVRVRLAGICGTDLALMQGYAGFSGVPGHEFVGVVEAAPAADRRWVGRRVVGEISVGCGHCDWCRHRVQGHCPSRTVLGIRDRPGAYAEALMLPAMNLHHVPDDVSDESAVFVEPVAAACEILTQIDVNSATRVVVLGDGRFGQIIGQVMASVCTRVVILGRHPEKLAVAREVGLEAHLESEAGATDRPFDVAIDATGRLEGVDRAIALVRPRGTVVVKSTVLGRTPVTMEPLVINEIRLVGSRCGPFEPALELLRSGTVRVAPLVARTEPLSRFSEALEAARSELKVLLRPPV